jgi:hypothetical protein
MEDGTVQREISAVFGEKKVVLRDTERAVSPFGGISVMVGYLNKIGYWAKIKGAMPFRLKSPNAIDPAETFTAFIVSVLAGARRFSHTAMLRADRGLHAMLGMKRFPTDDTIRNFFKRFTSKIVYEFYWELWVWQMGRIPERKDHSLDLDSTVFERYGKQEGAMKGYNPRKHGRPSHHPILAILNEAQFILHGWLRSGNCSSARGVVEFLKEALELMPAGQGIRVVRGDSGFFDDKLLSFLEDRGLAYIIAVRLTRWIKREAARVTEWRELDGGYAVGEFRVKLLGWREERRFVVVREIVREDKSALGRKLVDLPGYTFRIFVTTLADKPEEVWRDYNQRAVMEKRIGELKYDLAADDFCMKEFFATEAAFRSVLFLFNLLSEFQRVSGEKQYRQPATLRAQVFLCGAILGRSGRRSVIHMSKDWGGLEQRNPLFEKILSYVFPTSPKLTTPEITNNIVHPSPDPFPA